MGSFGIGMSPKASNPVVLVIDGDEENVGLFGGESDGGQKKREEEGSHGLFMVNFGAKVDTRAHFSFANLVVLNDAGALLFPLVDFLEPGVEGLGGAGEGEDDIDELAILGPVDGGMADGDFLGDFREIADGGDLRGNLAEAFLLLKALK